MFVPTLVSMSYLYWYLCKYLYLYLCHCRTYINTYVCTYDCTCIKTYFCTYDCTYILEPIFVPMFLPMFVASPTHVYLCFRDLLRVRGTVITHQGKCFFKCWKVALSHPQQTRYFHLTVSSYLAAEELSTISRTFIPFIVIDSPRLLIYYHTIYRYICPDI